MTPRPVLILAAIAAGGSAATGVLSTAEGVPGWVTLTLALVTAVATAVGAVVVQGQVTPNSRVAVTEPRPGVLVSGEAGPVDEGKAVDVTETGPSPYAGDRRPGIPRDQVEGRYQGDDDAAGPLGRGQSGQITGTLVVVIVLIATAVAIVVVALADRIG